MAILRNRLFLCGLIVWSITSLVDAYGSGAPNSNNVCTSLIPGHGSKQEATSPYKLILIDVDRQLGVNLVATSQVTFAGFIVQARNAANVDSIVDGEFVETENSQVKGCLSGKSNTWTHKSGQTKTQVTTVWIAPANFNGSIVFRGTVVQVKQAYWDQITSEPAYFLNGALVDKKQFQEKYNPNSNSQSSSEGLSSTELNYGICSDKLCIGLGNSMDCLSSKTCQALLAGSQNPEGDSEFALYAKPVNNHKSKYYSMALSTDNKMGDDFVVDCFADSSGKVNVGLSYNIGKSNEVVNAPNVLREPIGQYSDGIITCKWRLNRNLFVNGKVFDLLEKQYHIFLAQGDLENDLGYKNYHDMKTLSSEPVNLALVGGISGKDLQYLIQIHGSLMVISWLGLVSVAIIFARYFKNAWEQKLICGVKIWFAFHRPLMVTSVVLMIVAQICIFYYVGEYRVGLHQILGSIAFILALLNPIGALFRPHPDSSNRWMFNWMHWLGGNVGHIAAAAAILVASSLKLANLTESFLFIVIAWILFHVVIHLIFQFHSSCVTPSSKTSDIAMNEMQHDGRMYIEGEANSPSTWFRSLLLAIYVIVSFSFVTILVLLIAAPKSITDKIAFL